VKIGFAMTGFMGGRGGVDNLSIMALYPCDNAPTQVPPKPEVPSTFILVGEDATNLPSQEPWTEAPSSFIGGEAGATEAIFTGGTMTFETAQPTRERRPPEQTSFLDGTVEELPAKPQHGTLNFDQVVATPAPMTPRRSSLPTIDSDT
jgi:hypothetical protein